MQKEISARALMGNRQMTAKLQSIFEFAEQIIAAMSMQIIFL